MDSIKVAKDYFISSQNKLLLPNREFGRRKFLHVGNRKNSTGTSPKTGDCEAELPNNISPSKFGKYSLQVETKARGMRATNKQWVHPPEALLRGHILYNVKYLGDCEVERPKGTDVVKEAIRKSKFNKQIRRAEGQKPPKVELTISADGVTIQDPKSKMIMHQYPLHRISYCADDKSDKRMFTFIAKAADTNIHNCYVFDSEKCAEEITLTIGQAFDLAYRRFMDKSSKDMDLKKQFLLLQRKVQVLQQENDVLKRRIADLEHIKDSNDITQYKKDNRIDDLKSVALILSEDNTTQGHTALPQSPVSAEPSPQQAVVGRRLEGLVFDDSRQTHTNGTAQNNGTRLPNKPLLSPPPAVTKSRSQSNPSPLAASRVQPSPQKTHQELDIFGSPVFGATNAGDTPDPFGMGVFQPSSAQELDKAIQNVDRELLDLQSGFSQGLSFGTDDFSLQDLDPLNQK